MSPASPSTAAPTSTVVVLSFAAGAATALALQRLASWKRRDQQCTTLSPWSRENAGATPEGDDLSLFYSDRAALTTITDSRRFLPSHVYGALVRDAVVCCVDVVLVRQQQRTKQSHGAQSNLKECLLVERSTEPVKGVWWWPGGRLLKGETFFDAARRKAKEEVGIEGVKPIQVLGVWNTFFPTSAWDSDELGRGTQTVNPIVLVEITDPNCEIRLDDTSENHRWISLDPILAQHEDPYVQQALLRLQAWNPDYIGTE